MLNKVIPFRHPGSAPKSRTMASGTEFKNLRKAFSHKEANETTNQKTK
ncbi:hypothetical protein [Bartonella quintana]|nr:hypothetical protein [Bartonella quintana]